MRLLFLVLAAVGLASASPLQAQDILTAFQSNDVLAKNSVIEQALLEVLERVRQLFLNGSPSFPQLDPYERDHIHIYGALVGLPGSHLTLIDTKATGLASFEIPQLTVEMTSLLLQWYRVDFEIVIPSIEASVGNYDLDVTVWDSRYYGNGDISLKIENIRLIGYLDVSVRVNNGVYLNINDARVTLRLSTFKTVITGIFGSEATSQYISEWLTETIPDALEKYQDDVIYWLSLAVRLVGNRFFEDRDIGEFLPSKIIV